MKHPNEKRFEDFFAEDTYVLLKNYLYNYLLRQRVIRRAVAESGPDLVLEVGSGLSPMITGSNRVVYSELSYRALRTLKHHQGRGMYVVADGTRLPFRDGVFSHTVCSEVIEHVEDDQAALNELARVMRPGGLLCLTVPHRKFYFAADDRFVRHFRRYEIDDVEEKLGRAGLRPLTISKVLGPMEKITMYATVMVFSLLQNFGAGKRNGRQRRSGWAKALAPFFKWGNRALAGLAWLDAKLMPRALATVILVQARKAD